MNSTDQCVEKKFDFKQARLKKISRGEKDKKSIIFE